MKGPVIKKEHVQSLLDTRFIRVFDLQYAPGKHYYDATRHRADELNCLLDEEEARKAVADAVGLITVLLLPSGEEKLLLSWEYRYPCGRFLLSPPAGLIDPEDRRGEEPLLDAAKRELSEETGLTVKEGDVLTVVNPLVYSSPGMTDESNALVLAILHVNSLDALTQKGASGSECFDGFCLLDRRQARELLISGRDPHGHFYSVYTWAALMCFVSGLWK